MPTALPAFSAKLVEIAQDYERLHLYCLSLEDEIASLRGTRGQSFKASVPRMLAETPRMSSFTPTERMSYTPKEGQLRRTVSSVPPAVPQETLPRLLVTPRLRCHTSGVTARPESPRNRLTQASTLGQGELEEVARGGVLFSQPSRMSRLSLSCFVEKMVGQQPSQSLDSWSRLTQSLLYGGRSWKLDPVWETNIGIRSTMPTKIEFVKVVSRLNGSSIFTDKASRQHPLLFHFLPPFHPDSTLKQLWDLFSIFLLFHDLIMVPLLFFGDLDFDNSASVSIFKACFWTADMLLSFVTGYNRKDGELEMNFCRIVRNYMRGFFIVDFSIIMLDWILLSLTPQSSFSGISRMLFRSVRGLRLLRLAKGLGRTKIISQQLCTEYMIVRWHIFKLLFCIALASHYIACFWYGLSQLELVNVQTHNSWAKVNLDGGSFDIGYAYTTSLHWALTQFTPASMEVVPENAVERVFACIVILTALVVFSSFVSSITQAMNYIRQLSQQKRLQECAIRKFFEQRDIPHDTSVKIWRFIKRHKLTESALVRESDLPVLQQLPSKLRVELKHKLYLPILTSHPLFICLKGCDREFVGVLCNQCLREEQVGVGTEAFPPGSEINDMVFVFHGVMEFIPAEVDEVVFVEAKEWVCELSLWANSVHLPGVLMGFDRGAELVLLNSTKFRRSARKHSHHFNLLADYALRFVKLFQQLSQGDFQRKSITSKEMEFEFVENAMISEASFLSKCVLFNEFDLVSLIVAYTAAEHPHCGFTRKDLKHEIASRRDETFVERLFKFW